MYEIMSDRKKADALFLRMMLKACARLPANEIFA